MAHREENPSFDLAAEYVVEELHDQLDSEWGEVLVGSQVTIGGMEDCDCIPLSVIDRHGGIWFLYKVRRNHPLRFEATYESTQLPTKEPEDIEDLGWGACQREGL